MSKKQRLEDIFYTLPKHKQKELLKKLRFRKKGKKKQTIKDKERFYAI